MPDQVYELRQYTLHDGQRDVLVDLFDREFVESQEAVGCRIVGQFRDLDRPDRFVWVRGFRDMATRAEALTAFYTGPVWRAHAAAANATMVDSDDVLLLRPTRPGPAFPPPAPRPPAGGAHDTTSGVHETTSGAHDTTSIVTATVYHRDTPVDADVVARFTGHVEPVLVAAGAKPLACLQTEPAENNFPALPVRTGEHVLVWFAWFADEAAHRAYRARVEREPAWPEAGKTEELRLAPTARSALR